MGSDDAPTRPNGLPVVKDADAASAKSMKMLPVFLVVLPLVGFAIALAAIGVPAEAKTALIRQYELQWLFLGMVLLRRCVAFLNMYPMLYKARVMLRKSGNLRANMYLYKAIGKAAAGDSTVVLHDDGDEGKFNRANRSLHHFTEEAASTTASFVLAALVYPVPAFVCAALTAAGAVLHQIGYAEGGYGKHGKGFGLRLVAGLVLEGMLLVVALNGFAVL